jgi:predicted secreted protein
VNILPILAIGGALYFLSKKKDTTELKALPPAKDLGTVFGAGGMELPDLIVATVGERFSIAVDEIAGTGYSWNLTATPPDNVIGSVDPKTVPECSPRNNGKYCYIPATGEDGQAGGLGGRLFFIFEAKEPGEGSLVLHLTPPGAQAPPAEVIDIKVQITGA